MKQPENTPLQPLEPSPRRAERHPAAVVWAWLRRLRLKTWVVLGLVFLLFLIIFIIPAGRLPGIRNLAWMMGFSPQDTQSVSFGHALLTWVGDGGSVSSRRELSLFDRQNRAGFNPAGPQSGLFDVLRVNAARRAQGLGAERVFGVSDAAEDPNRAAYRGAVSGLSAQAQEEVRARSAAEVYFGTDADQLARTDAEETSTAGSANTAKLHARANIVGGSGGNNWLDASIERATRLSRGEMDQAMEKATHLHTPLSQLNGSLTAGDKNKQDLARVWLLSQAAHKAPQPMLKKQLAEAGYMAMEMPKKVYDSMGEGSGIRMRGDEIMASFEEADKKLLSEEQCRDLGMQANSNIDATLASAREKISTVRNSVPSSCAEVGAFADNISAVKQNCKDINTTFSNMKMACGTKVKSEGSCQTVYLDAYVADANTACTELAAAEQALSAAQSSLAAAQKKNPPDADEIDHWKKEVATRTQTRQEKEQAKDNALKIDQGQLDNTFNVSIEGTPAGGNDFFPTTEQNTGWLGD